MYLPSPRRLSSIVPLAAIAGLATAAGVSLSRATRGLPAAMGASARRISTAVTGAPHHSDGVFSNVLPSTVLSPGTGPALVKALLQHGDKGKPRGPVPLADVTVPTTAGTLAVTWLGHASALIELDGHWILADPVWGERVSPSATVGPRRLHPVPMTIGELPRLTAVIISHDHYDHLDLPTVKALTSGQDAPFLVPRGIGAHPSRWGVPENRIVELDWNESTEIDGITFTCTEARHFSGRGLKRNVTLWSSWALAGPTKKVYFGGDTGYTPAFAEIGARLGPFDLTLLPIGAYGPQWPDIHMDPEEAWRAHGDLGGALLVPIHWATFDLAFHTWAEPIERLIAAAGTDLGLLAIPRPGERIVVADAPAVKPWWSGL